MRGGLLILMIQTGGKKMIYKNGSAVIITVNGITTIFIPHVGQVAELTEEEGGMMKAMEMVDNYLEQQKTQKI